MSAIDLRQIRVVESEYREFYRKRERERRLQLLGWALFCAAVVVFTAVAIVLVSG